MTRWLLLGLFVVASAATTRAGHADPPWPATDALVDPWRAPQPRTAKWVASELIDPWASTPRPHTEPWPALRSGELCDPWANSAGLPGQVSNAPERPPVARAAFPDLE